MGCVNVALTFWAHVIVMEMVGVVSVELPVQPVKA